MAEQQPPGSESDAVGDVIRREMQARRWGWPDIDRHEGPGGISGGSLRQIATGRRRASRQMLERIAVLFDIDHEKWTEWRLANARHLLDERDPPDGVGREAALRALSHFEEGQRAARDRTPATPAPRSQPKPDPRSQAQPATGRLREAGRPDGA